jgi:hypothetical protein
VLLLLLQLLVLATVTTAPVAAELLAAVGTAPAAVDIVAAPTAGGLVAFAGVSVAAALVPAPNCAAVAAAPVPLCCAPVPLIINIHIYY